jgi:hypothetical protein
MGPTTATAGTRLGHFKVDFSTDSTTDLVPEVSYMMEFLANSSHGIDISCSPTLQVPTSIVSDPGPPGWSLITTMYHQRCTQSGGKVPWTTTWGAEDWFITPAGDTFLAKGPEDFASHENDANKPYSSRI